MPKTQQEFIQKAQDNLFFEYRRLRADLLAVLDQSKLSNFYKAETLFDFVEGMRREN